MVDNQGIRSDHCTIANVHRANDACVAPNINMVAYGGSAWSRSCANRAHMMKCAVGSDLGGSMDTDGTTMGDDQAWSDLSVGVNVDQCHYHKQLSYDADY
jgi:hypothetical protein